ncbi:DUF2235 domain-containing protein [Psychromonas sp. KJ10-2]|uniref:DUF2235 domain-containing protein n=1 Tax=Psychromonas sp. KJ10-2 TaxID=3391822 RepID=UPI0039B46CB1
MKKRIVICADGTWNHPENDLKKDFPTNILKLARAIKPFSSDQSPQQVFYDWGIGSYYDNTIGGATGRGLHKNIMDNYRYIIQNYSDGDELFLFGFSRGAYTIRCLCGLINNCGILKRDNAKLVQHAFNHYKKSGEAYTPSGKESIKFRNDYCHQSREVKFVGVWDTVGAMGIPLTFLGLFNDKDEFYDNKIGSNVLIARHALAIDEHRCDFIPTIWSAGDNMDIKQVWFAGAHSDIGGSYPPDKSGTILSDNALSWMLEEVTTAGLDVETHLQESIKESTLATMHNSRRSFYRIKSKYFRTLDHGQGQVLIHKSVKYRWDNDPKYRPKNVVDYLVDHKWSESIL